MKVLSPNGFHAIFYQSFWKIVGIDVCNIVCITWNRDIDLAVVNTTNVVLVPMLKDPKNTGH